MYAQCFQHREGPCGRFEEPVKVSGGKVEGELADARRVRQNEFDDGIMCTRIAAADGQRKCLRFAPCSPLLNNLVKALVMSFRVKIKQ